MRILHIGKYYYPFRGGMESVIKDICEGIADRGEQVEVVCSNQTARLSHDEIKGVRVTRLARFGVFLGQCLTPSLLWFMRAIAGKFDLVHVHTPNPLAELATLFIPKNVPVIVTHHSDIVRQKYLKFFYRPIQSRFLRRATKILVATQNHIQYSDVLPDYREKCLVVPFGINTDQFKVNDSVSRHIEAIKKQYGGFALFVGRLVEYKGLRVLIEAMKEVNHNLVILGQGPLYDELYELSRDLGVASRVHILGRVEDAERFSAFYHATQVLVLPSITPNENFGMVQLEAMACSKPVITTNLKSGVPCVGIDNKTCRIVAPGNPLQLARTLATLMNNPELCEKMGRAGRKRFEELYTLEGMVENHHQEYLRTLALSDAIEKAKRAA